MIPEDFAQSNLLYYCGDIHLESHGGAFFNLNDSHFDDGYLECLRVTPMCDFPLILIESLTLIVDCNRIIEALESIHEVANPFLHNKATIAEALLSYGHYDPAEMGYEHHTYVLLTEEVSIEEFEAIETAGLSPDLLCLELDEDGDLEFDSKGFWEALQIRANLTFTDYSE